VAPFLKYLIIDDITIPDSFFWHLALTSAAAFAGSALASSPVAAMAEEGAETRRVARWLGSTTKW